MDWPASTLRPGQLTRLASRERIRQLPIVVEVAARRPRAALYAARLVEPPSERSPRATPWRERPPEMAGWPAKPAASDVVAHATAQRVLATRASSVSPVEAAVNSTRNLRENLRDFSTLFSLWSRLFDQNG